MLAINEYAGSIEIIDVVKTEEFSRCSFCSGKWKTFPGVKKHLERVIQKFKYNVGLQ